MRYHFIAIGGAAMHNLAIALSQNGHLISGSDDEIFEPSRARLLRHGLLPACFGWFPERITPELDGIILGMHARADNPELAKALELGIPVYSYPAFLFEQFKQKTRVVVAGSHGKTTITSMILHAMHKLGHEPDYMVGAQLEGFDVMVKLSQGPGIAVLEGDEYLTSPLDKSPKFLHYKPDVVIISGIAWDHMNVFPTFDNYLDQFRQLLHAIPPGGTIIYHSEDPILVDLIQADAPSGATCIPYQLPAYKIIDGQVMLESKYSSIPLQVFGKHNLRNIMGAVAICQAVGLDREEILESLKTFTGASRRLEKLFSNEDVIIFRDFAHAPSKLQATTEAVKEQFPTKTLIACMELHTFSSLNKAFLPQYEGTMKDADEAIVFFHPDTVSRKRLEPLDPAMIRQAFGRDDLVVFEDPGQLQAFLLGLKPDNLVLLLMSSGDFHGLNIDMLVDRWKG